MSLIVKGVTLTAKYLFGPIWSSSPSLLAAIWSRSSSTRYQIARRIWTRSLRVSLLWRTIFYGYWILFLVRIFLGSHLFSLPNGKASAYLKYDVWLYVLTYQFKAINLLGCSLSSSLFLFIIYMDYLINLRQFTCAWGVMVEFIILNPADFWRLNLALKPTVDFEKRPLESARNCLQLVSWLSTPLKTLEAATFKVKQLRYVNPLYTKVMRAQAVVLSAGLQVIFALILYIVGE